MDAPSSISGKNPAAPRRDGDRNLVLNKILLQLPPEEFDLLSSKLEFVRLKRCQVVHEAGETMKSAYFCNSGMFSVVIIMPDGKSVEVCLVGTEGFSGIPLVSGFRTSYTRSVVQAEATAFRIDAAQFQAALRKLPTLEREVQRFAQLAAMQVAQIAACNRLHEIEERLARWLLMFQDRLGSNSLPLTEDFLAEMLGSRRAGVSVAISVLTKAGLIEHKRGRATILDRQGLEKACCDCYEQLRRQTQEWQSQND
jgi:CRP-like cAMP-binding protein